MIKPPQEGPPAEPEVDLKKFTYEAAIVNLLGDADNMRAGILIYRKAAQEYAASSEHPRTPVAMGALAGLYAVLREVFAPPQMAPRHIDEKRG